MKQPSPLECRDTALALTFLCLLIWLFSRSSYAIYAAMAILLAAMIYPAGLKHPARLWFGLAHLLNLVVSRIILGLAFFLLVLPIGLVRKLIGKDPMNLKAWKNGADSAFVVRRHRFTKEDLDRQF